jgi:hypothetical protein
LVILAFLPTLASRDRFMKWAPRIIRCVWAGLDLLGPLLEVSGLFHKVVEALGLPNENALIDHLRVVFGVNLSDFLGH